MRTREFGLLTLLTLTLVAGTSHLALADQTVSSVPAGTTTLDIFDPSDVLVGSVTFNSSFRAHVAAYAKPENISVEYQGEFSCLEPDGVTVLACTYGSQDFRRVRKGKNNPPLPLVTPKRRGDAAAVDDGGSTATFFGDDVAGTYSGTVIFTNIPSRGRSGRAGGTAHLKLVLTIDPDTAVENDEFEITLGFQVHVSAMLAP